LQDYLAKHVLETSFSQIVGHCKEDIVSNSHPKLTKHLHAHVAIIANEYWYGDGPPLMHPSLSAAKTAKRQAEVVDLLERASQRSNAKGDRKQARLLKKLSNKIDRCRRRDRCGSLACPECARAFQRAKADAQKRVIVEFSKKPAGKSNKPAGSNSEPANGILVMVTVIPLHLRYTAADLIALDIAKRTRWLRDILTKAGLTGLMVGSADISWEHRQNRGYYQLHWHLATWTKDPEKLQKRVLKVFPPKNKYDRPVVVTKARSLNFFLYMNKGIKLPNLLRRNRRSLSKLLLVLDRTPPLDLMVITGLRLSAHSGRLALRPFGQNEHGAN
jgi:hypothetical protein